MTLERCLAGIGPLPDEFLESVLCEEFGKLPSQIAQEPLGPMLSIVEVRRYEQMRRMVTDPNTRDEDIPDGPMKEQVLELMAQVMKEKASG